MSRIPSILKKYVLPNFPYALMFWFGCKAGEAYRLAPGMIFLKKLVYTAETLGPALSDSLPSFVLFDLCVGLAGAVIIYGVVAVKRKNAKKYRKDVEYDPLGHPYEFSDVSLHKKQKRTPPRRKAPGSGSHLFLMCIDVTFDTILPHCTARLHDCSQ